MRSSRSRWCGVVVVSFLAMPVFGAETETGDLQLKPGFVDPKTGLKIEEIVVSPSEDVQEVHMSVPASTGPIEEVIVHGKAPSRKVVPQKKHYTFVRDYDHDNYGLVIYIGKDAQVPLRLYLNSRQHKPGSIEP